MKYISAKDTNVYIRQALKKAFPSVTFRVYLYGNSTTVRWTDGPTAKAVKAIVDPYEGSTFDGMIDLKEAVYGTHPKTGEQVRWGVDFIFEERAYSRAFLEKEAARIAKEMGYECPEITGTPDNAHLKHSPIYLGGGLTLDQCIMQQIQDISALAQALREPGAATTGATATKVEGGWQVRGTRYADGDLFRQYKDTLGFYWDKTDRSDRFWMCPVDVLPDDIQALVNGDPAPTPAASAFAGHPDIAKKLRDLGDNLQKQIDAKSAPAIGKMRMTYRRATIAASMNNDARRLEKLQAILYALAAAHEDTSIHPLLKGLTTKKVIERLLDSDTFPTAGYAQDIRTSLVKAGLVDQDTYSKAKSLMLALVDPRIGEPGPDEKIKALERDLIGRDIPGYFPTPKEVVDVMLSYAGVLWPGMRVLEPSAGKGDIADAVKREYPDVELHCIELQANLREILHLKGHLVKPTHDIFEFHPAPNFRYDTILMNPPFEKGEDIDHVMHCYRHCLKDGGRLIAIMSEGVFFRQHKKETDFRNWLDNIGGIHNPLPDGVFFKSDRPTGVKTRVVVIDKPKSNASPFTKAPEKPTVTIPAGPEAGTEVVLFSPRENPPALPAPQPTPQPEPEPVVEKTRQEVSQELHEELVGLQREMVKLQARIRACQARIAALGVLDVEEVVS